ncbi:MAG: hypothetical protein GY849_22560, partial [Deltaproteobacteria bacterium]|nr:hypothetical protein [Deltaproteobacteria bacterium]
MSLAVYTAGNINYVWSTNEDKEISYTRYIYEGDALLYTLTGDSRTTVDAVILTLPTDIDALGDGDIKTYLSQPSMSLAVYTAGNINYVWSTNEDKEISYTRYIYVGDALLYTLTGESRTTVDAVILTLPSDIGALGDGDIKTYLSQPSMSLAVYFEGNIDYVWSTNEDNEISYTRYMYEGDTLLYTLTGDSRTTVDAVILTLPSDIGALGDGDIKTYLSQPSMSLAVYFEGNIDY